jgi:nucleotide-binding universal stress UspA family protein
MGDMKKIVVGYDGFERDEPLPALALALAEEQGAELHVVHVAEPPARRWRLTKDSSAEQMHQELVEERRSSLEELLASVRECGISVHSEIRSGPPHIELIRHAMAVDADLLIVVDEPVKRDGRRGFGTVTKKLFRKCPCPVLAKRSHSRLGYRAILAAVDVGPFAPDEEPPNQLVLELARYFTRRSGSRLYMFHAWSLWNEQFLRSRVGLTSSEVSRAIAEERAERREQLEQLLAASNLHDVEVEIELVKGDIRESMLKVVMERNIELVVMGTVCRTGLLGLLIGNTAEKILNELDCSVLAVKPDGFVSPVA